MRISRLFVRRRAAVPVAVAAVLLVCLAIAAPAPAAHAAKTGLVHQDGQIHWVKKSGKFAKSAFKHVGSKLYYVDARGNARLSHACGRCRGRHDHVLVYDHVVVNVHEAPDTGLRYLESYVAR